MILNGFSKKSFFKIGMWHSRPLETPPPFMANAILNFHFDFPHPSLTILLEVVHKIKKAGGQATLSVATVSEKTKMKLEIATTPAPPTVSSSTSSPTGHCHRRRGPRAKARRNQRAAAHQAALAEAAATAPPERSSASLLQCVPKKCYIAIWFC